ncbi:exo-beta-N-acetylmuramidase NamZ domain-containing protein [Paraburkholderia graminis]|uniref:exo-beta-N-acetylmuramidase NamZ domain-containing protein n=1 Tax=Paraburkholderia graminis TaxID=60548 RepID=UPI00286C18E4|nr:exo-beta-N-acetylmuramidase NamZ domain-containing protein [Paraburkholderia graminis]
MTQLDLYPEVAMIEGANVSVGRGTATPFELVGAPCMDGKRLAAELNALDTGARFLAADFLPTESNWHGRLCHGVRIVRGPDLQHSIRAASGSRSRQPCRRSAQSNSMSRRHARSSVPAPSGRPSATAPDPISSTHWQPGESILFAPLRDKYLRY